jgi:hypothetical protein
MKGGRRQRRGEGIHTILHEDALMCRIRSLAHDDTDVLNTGCLSCPHQTSFSGRSQPAYVIGSSRNRDTPEQSASEFPSAPRRQS